MATSSSTATRHIERARIAMGQASMRWSQRWPLRSIMERVFSKADAIDLPDYKIIRSETAVPAAAD